MISIQRMFHSAVFLIVLSTFMNVSEMLLGNESVRTGVIPLVRVVDMDVGETQELELHDGTKRSVKVISCQEIRDDVRNAVRQADVIVEVDGKKIELRSAMYNLPKTIANTQIDCPITKDYLSNSNRDAWSLEKDVRLRLWPAGSGRELVVAASVLV